MKESRFDVVSLWIPWVLLYMVMLGVVSVRAKYRNGKGGAVRVVLIGWPEAIRRRMKR